MRALNDEVRKGSRLAPPPILTVVPLASTTEAFAVGSLPLILPLAALTATAPLPQSCIPSIDSPFPKIGQSFYGPLSLDDIANRRKDRLLRNAAASLPG